MAEIVTKKKSSILDQWRQLAGVPEDGPVQVQTPEQAKVAEQTLKDALGAAEKHYQDQTTRNEWLEVAQTLGRALTQFGAAQAGMKSGRDMSGLQFGSPIDYQGRTDRAFKEYQTAIGGAEKEYERGQKGSSGKTEEARRYLSEALRSEESEADRALRERLAKEQTEQETTREGARERREQARLTAAEKRDEERRALEEKKLQEKDLQGQLKDARAELSNATTAASIIANLDDLSGKSVQKLETQLPGTLGKAGITPQDLAQIESEATDKGILWNSVDKEKRNQLIQQKIVDKKQQEISNIRQAIDALRSKRELAAPAPVGEQQKKPAGDPKVQEYADKYLGGDYEKAKGVLVGRGYKPAE